METLTMVRHAAVAVDQPYPELPLWRADFSSFLPVGWFDEIADVAADCGVATVLDGNAPSSRESTLGIDREPACVSLVDGHVIVDRLSWLDTLYRTTVREIVDRVTGSTHYVSPDVRSGVNINVLHAGNRYEWHVDTNPITALIMATTHRCGDGGALNFASSGSENPPRRIEPIAGELLVFDGRAAPHCVEPVVSKYRITVPMNFYDEPVPSADRRPLDDYLYGQGETV